MTAALERVLRIFLSDPTEPRYGYDLMKAAKLASGTLYPMLARLQSEGLVTSAWEVPSEDENAQRPRKYYQLTAEGTRVARLELAQASLDSARGSAGPVRPAEGGAIQ
ncbi:PadR family transcriptional regulator [Spirillospora sp. CA-294931]|uniref:PadR family transcriptional regulator n=1 Tax=Spirillospora sp. CA-294931 TaxID=3240042 RepID=UPI003D9484A1